MMSFHGFAKSRTALGVAIRRASHQLYDARPLVLDDPIAVPILGERYRPALEEAAASIHETLSVSTRAWLVVRNRLAEDNLARAVRHGVRQYVLLGAGLDTFAYRNPHPGVRVFEVDHPATQGWKRKILGLAAIAEPDSVTYVPVNFEQQTAVDGLIAAGFDASSPAFFAWLGVTMYLPEETVFAVLRAIAALPPASGVVFDYAIAKSEMSLLGRMAVAAVNQRLKQIGEPWVTFFSPGALATHLNALGFQRTRDLDPKELNARYFSVRTDRLRLSSFAHVMTASV